MPHADAQSRNHMLCAVEDNEIELRLFPAQSRDPVLSDLKLKLENENVDPYELCDGVIYRKNSDGTTSFFVPTEMRINLFRHIHEKIGHLGISKVYDQIWKNCWFPRMRETIEITYIVV